MAKAYRKDPETGKWLPYDPDEARKSALRDIAESREPSVRRRELERYAAVIDQLGDNAASSLWDVLMADLDMMRDVMTKDEWREFREALIEDLYQTRLYWSDAAGAEACDFYDSVITNRDETGMFNPAQLPDQVSREQCAATVRALAHYIFDGHMDKFVEKVVQNARDGVRGFANETIIRNARRDGAKGVRYARVPVGVETCAFCIMLASRGFVYHSKESAEGNAHTHPDCDCKIVPGFEGDVVEGYDPEVYEAIYESNRGYDSRETINNIRREYLYPVHKEHINETKRQWWAANKDEQNAKRRAKAAERRKKEEAENG